MAGATANAQIDHVRFVLSDLAPDDGIAPSFRFPDSASLQLNSGGFAATQIENWERGEPVISASAESKGWLSEALQSLNNGHAAARAEVTGEGMSAAGQATGVDGTITKFTAWANNGVGRDFASTGVWLAPMSALTLEMDIELYADVSLPDSSSCWNGEVCFSEQATAGASITLNYATSPYSSTQTYIPSLISATAATYWRYAEDPVRGEWVRYAKASSTGPQYLRDTLSATVHNDTGSAIWAIMSIHVGAFGQGTNALSPVPEASSTAMFATGFLAMGLFGRRRSRHRA